jgi:tRNA modification GTPase
VLDTSEPFHADDERLLSQVPPERRIVLLNKSDLPRRLDSSHLNGESMIEASALTGEGFAELTDEILSRLSKGGGAVERDDIMITDARQHEALKRAVVQLAEADQMIAAGELEEIVLLRLRGALSALGEITGETLTEDILSRIFSTFCIGK